MRPVTPRGFRDVLPAEAAEREELVRALGEVFSAWGYGPVETPVVERLDALEAAAGPLQGTAFRLLDLDGELLALRPDMTVPIARLSASRLAREEGPHRFRYATEVFREHESLRGQARQFTQAGVEFIGAEGPAADAEVVAVLVEALAAVGLSGFTVAMGSVSVLAGIIDASGMDAAWGAEVFSAAHDGNMVGLDRLASFDGVSMAAARAVREVPRIRGGAEAIDAARIAAAGCGCEAALDSLAETYRLLDAIGLAESVQIDFSVMRSFDYYSGLVFEAYAPGLGVPLAGGGRYDGLLAGFGMPRAAAGFALGLERLMIALVDADEAPRVRALDAVIGGDPSVALPAASALRRSGWRVALSERTGSALVREADRRGAVEALMATSSGVVRLDRGGERALPLEDPVPYPPTLSWAEDGDSL